MCFSASASFVLGSALVVIGAVSAAIATRVNRKWMALALIPVISGIQQLIEGIIWLRMDIDKLSAAHFYSYLYLFIAYSFWPAYVPICSYLIEPNRRRKKIFQLFVVAGLLTSASLYIPILLGVVTFSTVVENYSIHYLIHVSSQTIWIYSFCYATTVILPLLLSSMKRIQIFGLMMLVSSLVAYWWYAMMFTSVWCFFAAMGSAYILALMYKLPKKLD